VAEPDVKEKFAKLGVRAEASSPDQLMQRLKSDIEKWSAVIKKAGIPQH
jgi:tripartite-type tricarboxylate transporter receptor subunit TctC